MKMPTRNTNDDIERLAREAEDRKILNILKDCKSLEEAIEKIAALIK